MTDAGRALPDTDWHVRQLYEFAEGLGATVIAARYSRYVVDLNRASTDESLYDGQVATGLCPQKTFDGDAIYRDGEGVTAEEQQARVTDYWQPYHDRIAELLAGARERFGYALLWDAHSIPSEVPRLFDGRLPALNIGTNDGRSCAGSITRAVTGIASGSGYSTVVDGRFRGGHITRHFGAPQDNVHAIQLELSQRNYMDEIELGYDAERAARLAVTIEAMLRAFLSAASDHYDQDEA